MRKMLKGTFVSLVAIMGLCQSVAAQDTVYINKKHHWVSNKADAVEYGVMSHKDGNTIVAFYTLNGQPKGVGSYSIYSADKQIRNGKGTYLYRNGKDSIVTNYVNNKLNGETIHYYPSGEVKLVYYYKNGDKLRLKHYFPNGAIKREEAFKAGKSISGFLYNEKGEQLKFEPYFTKAEFPGGEEKLLEVISDNLSYPEQERRNHETGQVFVGFFIDKNGNLNNPKVLNDSNNANFNIAAVEAIINVGKKYKFTPCKEDGKTQIMYMAVPVTFKMN